ncbi:MAG: hypothetical protein GYA21_06490 [Myxococcales bacterium]|nr:hypothetical protein [Myxococcales bacterium]
MRVRDRRQGRPDSRKGTDGARERRRRDRRRDVRVPVRIWVEEIKDEELYFQQTGNLSVGGVFFERTIPHPKGTRVKLRFSIPGRQGVIEADGEVVSTSGRSDGTGAGIRFIDLDPVEEKLIREYVEAQLKSKA